jgi:predicted MFS family arabinose efflux permease
MGQGMLSIAVQSYILEVAGANRRTRGSAIIVSGYNGGMISGAAIGTLLAVYMGPERVFAFGGIVALFIVLYGLTIVPKRRAAPDEPRPGTAGQIGFFRGLFRAARDWEFLKATLLVGIPTKATVTGITVFALPLLLSRRHYAQEDIGQIIMLYSAGVLISSAIVSGLADRIGRTSGLLFAGTVGSGVALALIGLMGWGGLAGVSHGATLLLIGGLSLLGLSHGFINAPVMTHIGDTPAADAMGRTGVVSIYRLVERGGHIAGPILVGQLLVMGAYHPSVISMIGLVILGFGVVFAFPFGLGGRRHTARPVGERAVEERAA